MKRLFKTAAVAYGLVAALAFVGQAKAEVPETDEPIKLAINDWNSQYITSYIIGGIFERLGYSVEYVQADAMAQFAGIEMGDLDVQVEIWPTTQGDRFAASLATADLLDMGELGLFAREEWWFPEYMKEQCPGLPNWEALKEPSCAAAFATAETGENGRYLAGPATWEGFDEERVESLGIPYAVVHAGSDAAMWAEAESAYQRQAPILQWFWVPHWWPAVYKGEFVEFPAYTPECYNDPAWGINPEKAYDCGKPKGAMHKAASAVGEAKWPKAYDVFRKMQFDDETYSKLIYRADVDGEDPKAVAEDWIATNESYWKPWTE
jgi:glycine betaine/proline transport system substrate-binding protein